MTKLELLEQTFDLFQGQAASIVGSLVSAELYNIDTFSDVDVFFDSSTALHYGIAHAQAAGYELDSFSKRKMTMTHRWGGKRFHVETYRLTNAANVELNLTYKMMGGEPVRGLAAVLLTFDFGFLLAGYDCLADTFEDSFLDLRQGFFPKEYATNGPYPMAPDKRRVWERAEFGQNNAIRQAQRTAKYALRGYDMSAVVPSLVTGYALAAQDQLARETPKGEALADVYLAIKERLEDEEWTEILEACEQLGFNSPVEEMQAVFD